MIRVSVASLLVSFTWTLPALAQDSISLDFTVAQTDHSQSVPATMLASSEPTETPGNAARTVSTTIGTNPKATQRDDRKQDTIALSFALPDQQLAPTATSVQALAPQTATQTGIFNGGSDSLVARTIGHAEGTRTPDGSRTRAYYGHSDPGNGMWNLGSFSYQHPAQSPEEADTKQLQRLQAQAETIRQRAVAQRLNLSLEEELNALDLANQSPLAALDTPGYVEWLKQAHARGLSGSEAVLWARTQSYWDVQRHHWDAPGLGNSEGTITYDQKRRLTAIARALDNYQQQVGRPQEDEPQDKVVDKPLQAPIVERIIFQDLSPPVAGVSLLTKDGGVTD